MKGIITFLFEMFWHYYSLLVSMEPGDTLVELVFDDIPDWFASKTRMIDPPEGDSWCADVFGVRKDKTGLVERFGADIEYLLEKYEEGQRALDKLIGGIDCETGLEIAREGFENSDLKSQELLQEGL